MKKTLAILFALCLLALLVPLSILSAQPANQPAPGVAGTQPAKSGASFLVYFGTATGPNSKGIYAYRFNTGTGKCDPLGLAAEVERPTWLTVHPNQQTLYAVSEIRGDRVADSAIHSLKIDAGTGRLTFMNKVPGSATFLAVDKEAKVLLAAKFGDGQVAAFKLNVDGTIGGQTALMQHTGKSINAIRQTSPHPHGAYITPDSRYVIVPDLGVDKVFSYRLDVANGTLAPNDPPFVNQPAGYGPRHFTFHPSGQFGYLINELESAVTVFAYNSATGGLKPLQTISTLPEHFVYGNKSGAEIWVDQAGRFLYVSSRSDDSILVFAIDPRQGTLQPIQRMPTFGKTTWHFAADPTGQYLFAVNTDSDNAVVFKIDPATGRLAPTGQVISVPSPMCVLFVPGGGR
jgi:6-phosphogluconolactonase